jgi:hypothetical protein
LTFQRLRAGRRAAAFASCDFLSAHPHLVSTTPALVFDERDHDERVAVALRDALRRFPDF